MQDKRKLYSGFVWALTGCLLLIYGYMGLTNTDVPGVEELVAFVNSAQGGYLYLAAFLAILIEGLYVIGSFFPGSTLVLLIAIFAQTGGPLQYAGVIGVIYVGWLLAGLINIFGARFFAKSIHIDTTTAEAIVDNTGATWFPAFRANTEVAQIAEGHGTREVLLSSWRVKTYTSLGLAIYAFVVPFIIDIQGRTNEEGFWSLAIIAMINFGVAGYKFRQYKHKKTAD